MLQEARHHPGLRHGAVTACKHTVSGTISLPSRGAFHLSLTVLVRYRSAGIFSLTGWSPWIHARFHVARATQVPATLPSLSPTGLSPTLARLSSALRLDSRVDVAGPTTPRSVDRGLGSSLFVRHYWGNRGFFLFLWVLRCFSSPGSLHMRYGFTHGYTRFARVGFPIRTSPDQSLLPAPRGLSQVATSFIGSAAKASTVCP